MNAPREKNPLELGPWYHLADDLDAAVDRLKAEGCSGEALAPFIVAARATRSLATIAMLETRRS